MYSMKAEFDLTDLTFTNQIKTKINQIRYIKKKKKIDQIR